MTALGNNPSSASRGTVQAEPAPGRATCSTDGTPVIALDNVHVTYPGSAEEALRGVSLNVPAGQHVCILGGNGSGKSTLLQLINALVLPSEGAATVFGLSTSDPHNTLPIRSRAAYVFQHPEDQMVTSIVADDIAFGPENLRVPQPDIARRVDAALAAVGMTSHAQADPADLSGGQKQRVAIAGALAMEPEILLLDEPCAMLDTEGHRAIAHIIERLSTQGITIVHVTHFMEDALAADRVIILEHGRIAFDGTPAEAFADEERVRALGLEMPRAIEASFSHTPDIAAKGPHKRQKLPKSAKFLPVVRRCDQDTMDDSGRYGTGKHPERTSTETIPAIIFDDVSFSYAAARNPRKRTRSLFGRNRAEGATRKADSNSAGGSAPNYNAGHAPLALKSLSFAMQPGTLTALVGRTGSGKSTTAELACALKLPLTGTVRINGIDTADLERRRELRRQVGYVSQLPERQLFAETVFDDVAFGPRNLGLSEQEVRERVLDALRSVNLDPTETLLSRSPFALSGGQQRSVALAGVLAMRQPVLILDEPMAGLDPRGRAQVRALIRQLKNNGAALLMVTHSMDDVAELADQVIALDHGSLIAQGAPQDMLPDIFHTAPAHRDAGLGAARHSNDPVPSPSDLGSGCPGSGAGASGSEGRCVNDGDPR